MSTLPGNLKDKRFYSETPRLGKVILVTPIKSLVFSSLGIVRTLPFYRNFTFQGLEQPLLLGVLP
jgi:hypothetical protein